MWKIALFYNSFERTVMRLINEVLVMIEHFHSYDIKNKHINNMYLCTKFTDFVVSTRFIDLVLL